MDSKAKVLRQRIGLEFYGFPANYYEQYPGNIQKVTAEEVARVAKKYVHPDQVAVLVVGKEKDFDKPLSSLGSVTPIDVTIPEPGAKPAVAGAAAAAAKPAASTPEGIALVKKVQSFVGGKAKIDAIQAMHTVGTASMRTQAGPMDVEIDNLTQYPDMRRNVVKTPMGEMTMVSTPSASFMLGPMGNQDLPASQREAQARDFRGELIPLLKNIDNPKYTFSVSGTEKVGDVNAQVLEINADGTNVKWYVDPSSGKLLRKVAQSRMGEATTDYTEWKSFGGVNFPVAFTVTTGGQPSGGGKTSTVEINPSVDPKVFEKPSK
jgi:hypothetical protein